MAVRLCLSDSNCHRMGLRPITGDGSQTQKDTQQDQHDSGSEHVVMINVEPVYVQLRKILFHGLEKIIKIYKNCKWFESI